MTRNPDGLVTISFDEMAEADLLNKQFAELKIRVKVLLPDPRCAATVEEVDTADRGKLYGRIVAENGPAPQITIRPDEIPASVTLLFAARKAQALPSEPRLPPRLMLVQGPAPDCIGMLSDLGALVDVLHQADTPFETVRATYELFRDREGSIAAFRDLSVGQVDLTLDPSAPPGYVELLRIWRAGARVREERAGGPQGSSFGVRVEGLWWQWDDRLGASTNEHDPEIRSEIGEELSAVLSPAHLLGLLHFRVVGYGKQAGRPTITAIAHDDPASRHSRQLLKLRGLGLGTDSYHLDIDIERGVLLKAVALRGRDTFQSMTAIDIAFDEQIADKYFIFRPPRGEEIHSVRRRVQSERLSIHEAQRRAPFIVFTPSLVPRGWRVHCVFTQASQTPPSPARLSVRYRSRGGHEGLRISEHSAAAEGSSLDVTSSPRSDEVVRNGVLIRVTATGPYGAEAYLERDSTFVFLTSETLTTEQITTIAGALVPAASDAQTGLRSKLFHAGLAAMVALALVLGV